MNRLSVYNKVNHQQINAKITDMSREEFSRHTPYTNKGIPHKEKQNSDVYERTHNIENYNNYSKNGMLINNDIGTARSIAHFGLQSFQKIIIDGPYVSLEDSAYASIMPLIDSDSDLTSGIAEEKYIADKNADEQTNLPTPIALSSWNHLVTNIDGKFLYAFLDPAITKVYEYMDQGIRDYAKGSIGAAEVTEIIENMYSDMLSVFVAYGYTGGNDIAFNHRLLTDTEAAFVFRACELLGYENDMEGVAYAKENYGLIPSHDRFVYYNAEYYYANEELQKISIAAVANIAKNEGISNYQTQKYLGSRHTHQYDFNQRWVGSATYNIRICRMNDLSAKPPRDFVMFYTSNLYTRDDWENGSTYAIWASDSMKTNGLDGYHFHIRVPRGASLFKEATQSLSLSWWNNKDYVAVYDISKYLTAGIHFKDSLKEFVDKYVNNFYRGELVVWQGEAMAKYDVPIDIFFDDKRMFTGSELVSADAYGGFIKNFEFHHYIMG